VRAVGFFLCPLGLGGGFHTPLQRRQPIFSANDAQMPNQMGSFDGETVIPQGCCDVFQRQSSR
jgi:hypothetical protein